MTFACSQCDCVGFLQVIQFPPTFQKTHFKKKKTRFYSFNSYGSVGLVSLRLTVQLTLPCGGIQGRWGDFYLAMVAWSVPPYGMMGDGLKVLWLDYVYHVVQLFNNMHYV